jgi:hypothetical protein
LKKDSEGQRCREQAHKEAGEELKLKVMEKEQTIASMQKQMKNLNARPSNDHQIRGGSGTCS